MCVTHALVDNDLAGREAVKRAVDAGILAIADLTYTNCPGMHQSELEDFYDAAIIGPPIASKYGVFGGDRLFTATSKKWSERMKELFLSSGKPWDDALLMGLKWLVASEVCAAPAKAIHSSRRAVFDALVSALEQKVS